MSTALHWPLLAALTVALGGSSAAALLLHTAADRSEAASVVPVAVLWGATVVGLGRRLRGGTPWLLLAAGLAIRLVLVGTPPLLSDDLYRYLFEGQGLLAGHNPLLTPPQGLPGLDDALLAKVNHPDVSTVYPPLALLWFQLLALAGTPAAVQLASALVDALTPLALRIATRRDEPAWVYALHPLPALEVAQSGHVDLLAIGLAAWGVAAFRRGRPALAGSALLAGGAVKLLPFAWTPRVLLALRRAWVPALWLAIGLAISGPVFDAGLDGLVGLGRYAREWRFNPLAYPLVEPWLGAWTRPGLIVAGALAAVGALRHPDPGRTWLAVGVAFVALSPTVHPWYLLWPLVGGLLCGRPAWAACAVAYLPAYLVLLAYDPATGQWSEAPWLPLITWGPVLAVLAYSRRE